MKYLSLILLICFTLSLNAQPPLAPQYPDNQFQNFQMSMQRVKRAYNNSNEGIKKVFKSKGISYPSKHIYIRSFKASNQFELYARNNISDTFTLIKKYNVCALSGILGPKRWEGDRQVPEGFYFIEDFNPQSNYHLSLLINYPNYSDQFFSNREKPGGGIYIHGGCMTVGCLPMTNEFIEEIYTVCLQARTSGQMYIPVHIFPVRFTKKSIDYLGREYKGEDEKHKFWVNLKRAYDYFEATKKVPPTMYDQEGNYTF